MPPPWEFDPDDPLASSPKAVLWRAVTILGPLGAFLGALVYALMKVSVR